MQGDLTQDHRHEECGATDLIPDDVYSVIIMYFLKVYVSVS